MIVVTFCWLYIFFFFQAEDGIRDAQESRGLGDVYKRQPAQIGQALGLFYGVPYEPFSKARFNTDKLHGALTVSYTHLTLPTIYSV